MSGFVPALMANGKTPWLATLGSSSSLVAPSHESLGTEQSGSVLPGWQLEGQKRSGNPHARGVVVHTLVQVLTDPESTRTLSASDTHAVAICWQSGMGGPPGEDT